MTHAIVILIALFAAPLGWPDAITIDGVRHEGVFIHQTERMVLVHFPGDGRVKAVLQDELDGNAIEIAEDAAERAALEARWRLARDARRATEDATGAARSLPRPMAQAPPLQALEAGRTERLTESPVSDGVVPRVELRDVPLGAALKAMLRPMGLDFEVREEMIYISDPETLRVESWEPLETRVYDIKNFDATLPKIIVMNPGGQRVLERGGVPQGGFGPAFQGQQGAGNP